MKKILLSLIVFTALILSGCEESFREFSENPNAPEQVPANLVFNKINADLYNNNTAGNIGSNDQRPWSDASKFAQFWCINYNYYGNQDYGWTVTNLDFGTLYDVTKMEEEAIRNGAGALNPYAALGKFFRAYFFISMSNRVGDVPMTEALRAGEKIFEPKYDAQKTVFTQALKWLDDANSELASLISSGDKTLAGDIYFKNDLRKWQKIVNAYHLRVLISLQKKADTEGDMQIKQRFAGIIENPTKYPILTGMEDNLQFTFNSVQNKYPTNPDNFGFDATRNNMAETYIKGLTDLKDPRVFVVAEPADSMLRKGFKATDFEAYVGASTGEGLDDMSEKANKGLYSFINRKRFYAGYTAEPGVLIGYVEQCFNIAEAINRGWLTGNADDLYKKGVTASMKFYGVADAEITKYLDQTAVKYTGNTAAGLNQILTQKYLAFFQNSGWEAFYNQRRTGVPTFRVGPGNVNSNRIPKRWQYPISERNNNKTNYTDAVAKQFGGKDDTNMDMWLIK